MQANQIAEQSYKILLSDDIKAFNEQFKYFQKLQNLCNVSYSGEFGSNDLEIFTQAYHYWQSKPNKSQQNLIKHRVLAMAVKNVDLSLPYGAKKQVKDRITDKDFQVFKETFEVVRMLYFFFSEGKILLDFELYPINSTLHKVVTRQYKNFQQNIIVFDSIEPHPGKLLFDKINSFDSLIVIFPSKNIPRSSTTTALKIPYIPGILEAKVHREVLYIGDRRIIPHTLTHEIFHIFEHVFGIKPAHIFDQSNQEIWPNWYHGEGQLFYYQQQFKKHILNKKLQRIIFSQDRRKVTPFDYEEKLKQAN